MIYYSANKLLKTFPPVHKFIRNKKIQLVALSIEITAKVKFQVYLTSGGIIALCLSVMVFVTYEVENKRFLSNDVLESTW